MRKYNGTRFIIDLEMSKPLTEDEFNSEVDLGDIVIDFPASYYDLGTSYVVMNERDGLFHLFV